MPEPRIAFKAGRALRRDGTNWVDPKPTKGAIYLQNGDDGLLHFIWKNRLTSEAEEDLILFPSDASFVKVTQAGGGRTYVLKFSSSNQRHFFWMQDADSTRDEEFAGNVNRLLADPDSIPLWWTGPPRSSTAPEASTSSTATAPAASSSSQAAATSEVPLLTPEQLARIRGVVNNPPAAEQPPDLSLGDILTPANIGPLFTSHPDIIPTLFPHLPADLPVPPSAEVLQQIIVSPQFRAAVRNIDMALRTGLLGGLVRGLGLPEEAGTGIEAFLKAIQEQAQRDGGAAESMETD